MADLVKKFTEYYSIQSRESVRELLDVIINYDFKNYKEEIEKIHQIWKLKNISTNDVRVLKSNGSVGKNNIYVFAPLFEDWVIGIENFLRKSDFFNIAIVEYNDFFSIPANKRWHHEIGANFKCDLKKVFDVIDSKIEVYDEISLTILPDLLFPLSTNSDFTGFLSSRKKHIKFINNSDMSIFNRNIDIPINDQMINWKSGHNFYCCEFGTKHFLPIFYQGCNLLNILRQRKDLSDKFIVSDNLKMCNCGKNFYEFDFVSHFDNQITANNRIVDFSQLPNQLNGNYFNLQFLQEKDLIKVFYESENCDYSVIKKFFESNFDVKFFSKSHFIIGLRKKMISWKASDNQNIKFEYNIKYI